MALSPDALDYEPYCLITRKRKALNASISNNDDLARRFIFVLPSRSFFEQDSGFLFLIRCPAALCQDSPVERTQQEMTVEPPTSDTLNQPALTPQISASLLKHRAASADGQPQDVVCRWQGFLTVTFLSPHCHSLIPCIQLTDELPLRRHSLSQCFTKQSSQSTAKISGLLRERDCSGSVWLSLPSRLLLR